jgi:hypothetical protein
MSIKRYWPAIVAIFGAVLVLVQAAIDPLGLGGETILVDEGVTIVNGFLGAIIVSLVPNLTAGVSRVVKAIVFGLLQVTAVFVSYWVGGISTSDWLSLVILFLTGAGVLASNNRAPKHIPAPGTVPRAAAG